MKTGIITFHRALNYGAILQTYGLCKTLKDLGLNPEVLDYRSQAIEGAYRGFSCREDSIQDKIKFFLKDIIVYKFRKEKRNSFESFLNKYIPLKPIKDISSINNEYSIFITGSDQVFNKEITKNDAGVFLLDFVENNNKKYSYSASLGTDTISDADKDWFYSRLNSFAGISVRERSGQKAISDISDRPVVVSVDPTLLLQESDWREICSDECMNQQYIVLYEMLFCDDLYTYAQKIAKKEGLKVICINPRRMHRLKHPFLKHINNASPEKFLALINNAKYVVTSSFHGTVFSIIFKKQFSVIIPRENPRNDRIFSLLSLLNLENRSVLSSEHVPIDTPINWDDVNRILECERSKSFEYLNRIGDAARSIEINS